MILLESFCESREIKVFVWENWSYNQFHKILRLFDVLPNFPFTTSETMSDYNIL